MKGRQDGKSDGNGGSAAVPAILGGRSTRDSMPVHEASTGFLGGGDRGITNIAEEGDPGNNGMG